MSIGRFIYTLVLYLVFPFVILRLLWRSRQNPAYRQRISERLALSNLKLNKPVICVHAVSVGETVAAKPLIESLLENYPDYQLLLTSTTPTGSDRVKKLFSEALYDKRMAHVYFLYDLPEIIYRFLNRVQPRLLIVMETEIWPNLYAACDKRAIPIMLANARLSEKSMRGYQKFSGLIGETLKRINCIAVRSDEDGQRFKQLGATDSQLVVAGNIKFDLHLDQDQIEQGALRRKQWGEKRPVWVAASTHAGEEQLLLQIHGRLLKKIPDCLLVLIPRHFERFDEAYSLCLQTGLKTVRHSRQRSYQGLDAEVILGDTMGEMQSWYAAADVVFMGGSLVETGGHNPLEAVAMGKPVVSGSYLFNFEDVYPLLQKSGLSHVCHTPVQLETELAALLSNNGKSREDSASQQTAQLLEQFSGVTERLMAEIRRLLD